MKYSGHSLGSEELKCTIYKIYIIWNLKYIKSYN